MAPTCVSLRRIACLLSGALFLPLSAAAQVVGPFTWQLQPYCNVITLSATSDGPGFRLEGFDDQCGSGRRATLAGTAMPNPDGTIAFTFLIITVEGRGGLTAVTLDGRTLRGPWSDSAGNSGTLVFGVASPAGGPPRPTTLVGAPTLAPQSVTTDTIADGTIGATDVNAAQVQLRLAGPCRRGQFAVGASAAGALECSNGAPGGSVALGEGGLGVNTGSQNVAVGVGALERNLTGNFNTGIGSIALANNLTGSDNTAIGIGALSSNIDGVRNIAIGRLAGTAFVRGGNDNIVIGHRGEVRDANTIRLGTGQTRTFIAGIRGQNPEGSGEQTVVIDSNGQLGTISSSRRFKEDIADMGSASAGLLALRPVTFRYKQASADGSKPLHYGLIAEEVAEVYPDLVVRNEAGEIETVQYHKLTPMLVNEFQRQERAIDALGAQVDALQSRLAALEGRRNTYVDLATAVPVMEPASLLLIGAGVLCAHVRRLRKRRTLHPALIDRHAGRANRARPSSRDVAPTHL
jgi:Chaperone of endosialidase